MSKLQKAISSQYFTGEKMIELSKLLRETRDSFEGIDKLTKSLSLISDNLASASIILDRAVEEDSIEDTEYYIEYIETITNALPKEIGALSSALNITKKKKGIDSFLNVQSKCSLKILTNQLGLGM